RSKSRYTPATRRKDQVRRRNPAGVLDASSGKRVRHRLNTGGNRALNSALHIIAVCQIRNDGRGREYYLRKIAEGKTPAEAPRALKRRLSNMVYRIMKRDQRVQLAEAA
ncbi:transposase, partial [Streptomyces sp. TRM72054]|uniref:transposase n=1 Tax=Streptomyces sp. TRM72054 TaxID=2870562 RepID=UPI0021AB3D74